MTWARAGQNIKGEGAGRAGKGMRLNGPKPRREEGEWIFYFLFFHLNFPNFQVILTSFSNVDKTNHHKNKYLTP